MTTATVDVERPTAPDLDTDIDARDVSTILARLADRRPALQEKEPHARAHLVANALVPGERCYSYWRARRDLLILTMLHNRERQVDIIRLFNLHRNTLIRLKRRMPALFVPLDLEGDALLAEATLTVETLAALHDLLPLWRDVRDDTIHMLVQTEPERRPSNQDIANLFGITKVRVSQIRGIVE